MNYSKLSDYCRYGWADVLKEKLEESKEEVNIFWRDNFLFQMAAIRGGSGVIKVLMEYYTQHKLKDMDPESDMYLHARQPLVNALQQTYDSVGKILPDVLEIFKPYIVLEDDRGSQADLDDLPPPEFDEEGTDSHKSAEDLHSDSSHDGTHTSPQPDILGDSS